MGCLDHECSVQLNLNVLGAFSLSADEEPVDGLSSGAPARLLAFLALQRSSRFRRPYLAGLFWPDVPEAKARRRLSHNLWILQTALAEVAPSLVRAERETIGLAATSDLVIDSEIFETLLARADAQRERGSSQARLEDLEQALGLYTGHLLADHYEEWIEAPRQRLRDRYLAALTDAVDLQKSQGDFPAAIATARRMVEESPHAESAHAELIRLYWLAGRADDAARHYDAVDRLFRDDFGVSPGAELLDLRDRVQEAPGRTTQPTNATATSAERTRPELIGRADERRRLLEVVDRSFSDRAGLATVEGATGMGKTRLLQDVAEAAAWRGATVVWANHRPDARTEPYGPITHGLGSVIQGLRREQVLARLDPEWIRSRRPSCPASPTPASPGRPDSERSTPAITNGGGSRRRSPRWCWPSVGWRPRSSSSTDCTTATPKRWSSCASPPRVSPEAGPRCS